MLSLALVLALSPSAGMFSLAATVPAAQSSGQFALDTSADELIPFGQALGNYTAPTSLVNGVMTALLEDASGMPLWILQAEILPGGNVNGELNLLKYGTNPAQQLPPLEVHGRVTLDQFGGGAFSASIYSSVLGQAGEPMGRVVGLLQPSAAGQSAPMLAGRSRMVARAVSAEAADQMVIMFPPVSARDAYWGRDPRDDSRKIVVTHDAGLVVTSVDAMGNMSQAGQQLASPEGLAPAGSLDDGSFVADGVEGSVALRWWLFQ